MNLKILGKDNDHFVDRKTKCRDLKQENGK